MIDLKESLPALAALRVVQQFAELGKRLKRKIDPNINGAPVVRRAEDDGGSHD
jgi:hypothetical protein